jgi:uncharacterized protein YbjT (DUF2867 family)
MLSSATAEALLDAGYHVRAAVRSTEKGDGLAEYLKGKKGKFDYVIAKDLEVSHVQPRSF